MPSLKPLKSVAHNLAHHFASTLNYWDDDYAINHLANASKKVGEAKAIVDALSGVVLPASLRIGVVGEFGIALKRKLRDLLTQEGMGEVALSAAFIEYNFAVPRASSIGSLPAYDCISVIETASGRRYHAHLTERNN